MPPTSIFIRAASTGTSGMGNSRISVSLGPVLTAASTFWVTCRNLLMMPHSCGHVRKGQAQSPAHAAASLSKIKGAPTARRHDSEHDEVFQEGAVAGASGR